MQCTLVHNENMLDVARLFRRHDPEWLPCTPSELRDNFWIAVMDRGQMLGALTYLDGTSPKKCFITGICTLATHRRQGYARLLLRELLRTRPGAKIYIEMPRTRRGAVAFFKHYTFESRPGPFACPGGSVHMSLLDRAI